MMRELVFRWRGVIVALPLLILPWMAPTCAGSVWWFLLPFLAGVMLRIWARCYIGGHSRGRSLDADVLCQDGPYSLMRHPLYISNIFVGGGLMFWDQGFSSYFIFSLGFVCCYYLILMFIEDLYLKNRFGEEWREWAKRTYWIGGRTFRMGEFRQGWLSALRGDLWTWIWCLLILGGLGFRKCSCGF